MTENVKFFLKRTMETNVSNMRENMSPVKLLEHPHMSLQDSRGYATVTLQENLGVTTKP
jgi:hypothetical protein